MAIRSSHKQLAVSGDQRALLADYYHNKEWHVAIESQIAICVYKISGMCKSVYIAVLLGQIVQLLSGESSI